MNIDNASYNDTSRVTVIGLGRTSADADIKKAAKAYGLAALPDPAPEQNLFDRSAAMDADENLLLTVYNTSFGERSPDHLVENKIRIVDTKNLIGFANNKGQVIIKPQCEIATSFHRGKAIIGAA